MNGIVNVLKPTGMTSHDVVAILRRLLKTKKVGHTGTLDPNAAGVLPICVGKATKLSSYILEKNKEYICELTLGMETDTYDSFGKVVSRGEWKGIDEDRIREAFELFKGDIMQRPPMYSALKVNGKKLYELARKGEEVEIKKRPVTILALDIISIIENRIMFKVLCTKGTYIRSLCKDIGDELGSKGYMSFLLRTKSGKFDLESTLTLEDIESFASSGEIENHLYALDYPLEDMYQAVSLNERAGMAFLNGAKIYKKGIYGDIEEGKTYRIYSNEKFLGLAVCIKDDEDLALKPEKNLV